MPANEWNPETVFDVLSDERVRQILVATGESPQSAEELSERVDGSLSSLYRRIEVLTEYGFLLEETRLDPEGHHYCVYTVNCEEIDISLGEDTITIEFDGSVYEENPLSGRSATDER
ncbi:MAG: transcriptional regulator [Halobacteriales archaeon SW_9_67_25]|jgi:predicted transcriptional regulator|nr:MAG: transcriptional regulator [Halobacteriales archaeon SW_9_67_25]